MDWRGSDAVLPVVTAGIGLVLLAVWIGDRPPVFELRVPGLDASGVVAAAAPREAPPQAGQPIAGPGQPSSVAGTWPWFRGPNLDGVVAQTPHLARSWPASGPPVLWTVTLGEGYAAPVVDQGRVYVLDYDEQARADTMRCLSLDDGREIWRNSYPVELTRNHGISRTVPALVDNHVISIGPRCHVACWNGETGECLWLVDMVQQYGTEVPRWYTGQCPLIDGRHLILAPCGRVLLTALDWRTGQPVWETPNPQGWGMTHASIVPQELAGRRSYVYCASDAVVGVAAEDGAVLWSSREWSVQFATAPSPVILPDGGLFLSSGYGTKVGSILLQVQPTGDQWQAVKQYALAPKQFNSEQQTPIFFDGHLYGVRKHGGGILVCLQADGTELWNSGRDRFGHGPYLIADGLILVLSGEGELVMAEATPAAYRPLARWQVFTDGHDAWGPMALAGGRLIVRDMTRMSCLDLTATPQTTEQP